MSKALAGNAAGNVAPTVFNDVRTALRFKGILRKALVDRKGSVLVVDSKW